MDPRSLSLSVSYREHPATPALHDLVDHIWFFSSNGNAGQATPVQQCIPMGMVEVIVMLRGNSWGHFSEGRRPFPEAFVVGVMREPVQWAMSGNGRMMGIRLRPEAAIRLFGIPLKDMDPLYTDVEVLLGRRWSEGLLALREAPDEAAAIKGMERFLLQRLSDPSPTTQRFIAAMHQLRTEGTAFGHRALGDKLFVCDRQAQRLFKEHLGISPMAYHRILRFRQAYDRATTSLVQRWSDLAYDLGYADQAHFTRDFKNFCGFTPGMLQERRAPAFLLRGRLAEGVH